jgi:peptidyl-prolyl cis-trans isomerase D
MLQTMRDNAQGMIAKVIVFFIILVFALWGVESIVSLGGGEQPKATVGDKEITELEIQRLVEQQKNNLRRQFGEQYNEDLFNEGFLRQSATEQLINQKVALIQAEKLGLQAASQAIDEQIVSMPAFQLDGKFSKEQFQNVLRINGWSPLSFRADLANDLKVTQARAAFVLSSIETPFNVQLSEALDHEERTFRYVEITADALKDQLEITDEQVQARYDETKERYKTEELAAIEYVQLSRSALAAEQEVSDEDLDIAYQDYLEAARADEQRASSHILIEVNDERDEAAAKTLADELRSRLDQGEDFASLAKEYSDDIGTRNVGGSLGLNTKGAFVDEFETALYALEMGEMSAPVRTEFGYHIIRLDDVVAQDVEPLDAMKAQLASDIQNEKAAVQFAEMQQELSNVAFSSGVIAEVADIMSLPVTKSPLFSRNAGEGIAMNADIRRQTFEDNILLDREISPVVETADGALVFAVVEHQPAEIKPLAEVRDQIFAAIEAEQAAELAQLQAQAIQSGSQNAEWVTITTKFSEASDAPRAVQQKAFELSADESAVVTTPGGYSVVAVDVVSAKDWQSMQISSELVESGRVMQSRADMMSYQGWAKNNTEITRSGS